METTLSIQDFIEVEGSHESNYHAMERERALRRKKGHSTDFTDMVNMDRLHAGDNQEWTFVMNYIWSRLISYARSITLKGRLCEDIAASTVAHMYENRALFHSADYFIGYMYNYARFECFECMKKGEGAIVIASEGGEGLNWYIESYTNGLENLNYQDREKWDEWQDLMIQQIIDNSKRLPTRWRGLIRAYLVCQNAREMRRSVNINYVSQSVPAFQQLRRLIKHQEFMKTATTQQLDTLKVRLQRMPVLWKKVIRRVMTGKTPDEVVLEFWPDEAGVYTYYTQVLRLATMTIREVWPDPALLGYQPPHIFFQQSKGKAVDAIFKEVILDPNEDTFISHYKTAIGSKKRGTKKERKAAAEYWSNERWTLSDVKMIYEYREKGTPWYKLEEIFGSSTKVMKSMIEKYLGIAHDTRIVKLPVARAQKITAQEVRDIRAEYAASDMISCAQIAEARNLGASTILGIVSGKTWTHVEGASDLVEARHSARSARTQKMLDLAKGGMRNYDIAKEMKCSESLVCTVLKKANIETPAKEIRRKWEKEVIALARKGFSMNFIRNKIGGRSDDVHRVVEAGYPEYFQVKRPSLTRRFDDKTEDKIRKAYRSGKTLDKLAKLYQVHKSTIRNVIRRSA